MGSFPRSLPLPDKWQDEDSYVDSLLTFAAENELFRNLCGGIHILDFLTREPNLYTTVLPDDWRDWFEEVDTQDVLQLLLRQDLQAFRESVEQPLVEVWKTSRPPDSLIDYVETVRDYCLKRKPTSDIKDGPTLRTPERLPTRIAVGMKPKKIHEVENFASFVNRLTDDISSRTGHPVSDIVDFGSGQNYLGRTLASPPYSRHVIAIERRHHVVEGARSMDVHAKLAKKEKLLRNKKEWKKLHDEVDLVTPQPEVQAGIDHRLSEVILDDGSAEPLTEAESHHVPLSKGRITYIEHDIKDGNLEQLLDATSAIPQLPKENSKEGSTINGKTKEPSQNGSDSPQDSRVVVSLHSCGNLIHHGLRSLVLNPSVIAVAMIGCCYNLVTERLGPATYKLPVLRPYHPRLESTGTAFDPHGFPMSKRLEEHGHEGGQGLRLNITARMMAVQAPYNWGPEDSEAFFKRHFYRALLQRVLLDLGVVDRPTGDEGVVGGTANGITAAGSPLIVGSLGKAAFVSFHAYTRAALRRLSDNPVYGSLVVEKTAGLDDETISQYYSQYFDHKKKLAIIWSLMAFSAGVVESIIAVDRWLYLREQDCVESCWVEPVFDYALSPRNLVVVGIKRSGSETSK